MYEKILALIQANGPMLPVEIASKTQLNSFLAKAYMEELAQQGKLIVGEKIGSTPLFLTPGQEAQASQRVKELLDTTRTVGGHVGKDLDMSPEAVNKREQFKKHFEKAISAPEPKKKVIKWEKPKEQVTKTEPKKEWKEPESWKPIEPVKEKLVKLFTPKKVEKPVRSAPVYKPKVIKTVKAKKLATVGEYVSKVKRLFTSGQAKLVEEISEKKKKGKFIVDFPSSIGAIRYYVTVYEKKSINKSDIALAYTEASNKKLPALLITNGKLASGAEDYAAKLGGMFKWKAVH